MHVATALQRVLATAWVGGVWAVGFLVAPTLFSVLTRADAGRVAATVFARLHLFGLAVGVVLLVFVLYETRRRAFCTRQFWLLAAMTLLTAINHFGIAAAMQALRGEDGVIAATAAAQFGWLHGLSSAIFLAVALLGLWLVAGDARRDQARSWKKAQP